MKKKMIALLMSVTMIMTCLSACGGKEETADSTTKGDTTTEVFAEGESEKNSCTITFWYTYGDAEEEILLNKNKQVCTMQRKKIKKKYWQ